MPRLIIPYRPTAVQRRFHASPARFRLLRAGRRAGKTVAAINELIRAACRRPGHYWVVGPTYPILLTAERIFNEFLPWEIVRRQSRTERSYTLLNDSLIEFRSGHHPEHLVSVGLHGVVIDEAARLKREAWEENLRATLADRHGWAVFATTPRGTANWVYELHRTYPEAYGEEYEEFVFPTVENTAVPGLSAEVELARRTLPARYFRQDFEGSFEAYAGLVYPEFDPAIHLLDEACLPTSFARVVAGVDWGYTQPAAVLVLGQTRDGAAFVVEELYEAGLLVDEAGLIGRLRALRQRWGIQRFACDPAQPAYIEALRRAGLPTERAENDVAPGIQAVAQLLYVAPETGQPRLFITRTCRHTIAELRGYRWRSEGSEEPEKMHDHAMDALRYAVCSLRRPAPADLVAEPEDEPRRRASLWR